MRKIVAGLFTSIDGVMEAPEKWTGTYFTPEVGQAVGALIAASDTLLLGRTTYEAYRAQFEGNASDPMAMQMNAIRKVVLSRTLTGSDWQNTTIARPNEIEALKREPGQNINVSGSISVVRWLLDEGLLNELHLLTFPVLLGSGKRLVPDAAQIPLTLAESETFGGGVVRSCYRPA